VDFLPDSLGVLGLRAIQVASHISRWRRTSVSSMEEIDSGPTGNACSAS
jgi:hypothetical protein